MLYCVAQVLEERELRAAVEASEREQEIMARSGLEHTNVSAVIAPIARSRIIKGCRQWGFHRIQHPPEGDRKHAPWLLGSVAYRVLPNRMSFC